MNIFGIGLPEMAVIFVVALLIFGPKKLPEFGRTLGKTLKGFQDASREFQEEFKKEAEQIEKTVNQTKETMKAEFEPPQPKALAGQEAQAVTEPDTKEAPADTHAQAAEEPDVSTAETADASAETADASPAEDPEVITPTQEDAVESSSQA